MIPLPLSQLRTLDADLRPVARALEEASRLPGAIIQRKGDVLRVMLGAAQAHAAAYEVPFDFYLGRVSASLDGTGMPIAWRHRVASSVRVAQDAVEGAVALPYAIDNTLVEHVGEELSGVDAHPWNATGLAANAFAVESFVDELAVLRGACPLDYRRRLLAPSTSAVLVLDRAAAQSGWGLRQERGAGRGVAVQAARDSFLALVAEVEDSASEPRVRRVTCVIDRGSPDDAREAGERISEAIAASLSTRPSTRTGEAPRIEIHFLEATESSGDRAACAAAAVAPAIANAIFSACGKRLRRLPLVTTPKEIS